MIDIDFALEYDEEMIDSWTVIYLSPTGGKYNGKLTVTNKRLIYDARIDANLEGMDDEPLFRRRGNKGYFELEKDRIRRTEIRQNLIRKQILITLDDGDVHIFDNGMLPIDKLVMAIRERHGTVATV